MGIAGGREGGSGRRRFASTARCVRSGGTSTLSRLCEVGRREGGFTSAPTSPTINTDVTVDKRQLCTIEKVSELALVKALKNSEIGALRRNATVIPSDGPFLTTGLVGAELAAICPPRVVPHCSWSLRCPSSSARPSLTSAEWVSGWWPHRASYESRRSASRSRLQSPELPGDPSTLQGSAITAPYRRREKASWTPPSE